MIGLLFFQVPPAILAFLGIVLVAGHVIYDPPPGQPLLKALFIMLVALAWVLFFSPPWLIGWGLKRGRDWARSGAIALMVLWLALFIGGPSFVIWKHWHNWKPAELVSYCGSFVIFIWPGLYVLHILRPSVAGWVCMKKGA